MSKALKTLIKGIPNQSAIDSKQVNNSGDQNLFIDTKIIGDWTSLSVFMLLSIGFICLFVLFFFFFFFCLNCPGFLRKAIAYQLLSFDLFLLASFPRWTTSRHSSGESLTLTSIRPSSRRSLTTR